MTILENLIHLATLQNVPSDPDSRIDHKTTLIIYKLSHNIWREIQSEEYRVPLQQEVLN